MNVNEHADADDTTKEQQLLMTAWQSLVSYVSTCDDDDRQNALVALQWVANLITGAGDDEDGAAAESWSCLYCPGRKFSTEQGLASHMGSVHSDEEKSTVTGMKPEQQN